ncbi:MAG: sugar phosphate nucleotidyltransferase, partial [Polyangiales bacterium]
ILAGGLGTRLRAAVPSLPKVIAPVAGRPFAAWLLAHLGRQGLQRAVLCTGYLADLVEAALGDQQSGIQLAYARETKPLGTGGALRAALVYTHSDPVLVVNGDSLLAAPLAPLLARHNSSGAETTLALAELADTSASGHVELDVRGRVRRFAEKRSTGPGLVNAGVYVISRARLQAIPEHNEISLEHTLIPAWLADGIWAWPSGAPLLDIGTESSYANAAGFLRAAGLIADEAKRGRR